LTAGDTVASPAVMLDHSPTLLDTLKRLPSETAPVFASQLRRGKPIRLHRIPARQVGATKRRIVNLAGALTKFTRANIVRA
jgi:hypothetical protein